MSFFSLYPYKGRDWQMRVYSAAPTDETEAAKHPETVKDLEFIP